MSTGAFLRSSVCPMAQEVKPSQQSVKSLVVAVCSTRVCVCVHTCICTSVPEEGLGLLKLEL